MIQGFIAVVPSSWTPEVDYHPNLLRRGHSTCAVYNRCGGGWHSHGKTEDEAYDLLEEMTLTNFQCSNERGQPKRVGGKLEVDALLKSKL